jgi:ABC-type microcin C transport system permease subunit YejB
MYQLKGISPNQVIIGFFQRSNICVILLAICFHGGSYWAYFFDPEDGGDMFLRNVG